MKIFDCFMYLDEDVVLDLRLNYLNPYIDKFVIVESNYTHSGEKKRLSVGIELSASPIPPPVLINRILFKLSN